jgi:Fe-S cluster assembly protein SufD
MSIATQQNITQNFLSELTAHAPKASFTPFEKIADALKFLEEKGIPNNKVEDYKYCNVEAVIRKDFKTLSDSFTTPSSAEIKKLKNEDAINIVVVNGNLLEKESDLDALPSGLIVTSLEKAAEEHALIFKKHFTQYASEKQDAFVALSTAFAGNGIFLHLIQNTVIDKVIRFIYINSASDTVVNNSRNLFVIDQNSQISFAEVFVTENGKKSGKIFLNQVSEISCAQNAIVTHDIIQKGNENFFGIYTNQISQQIQSQYSVNTFVFGGSLVRNNLNILVDGEYAATNLNGLTLGNGSQLIDNHTVVDHSKPNCESSELYKGIADGKSALTFNGKIFVRKDAQKINAYQSSKNILMSDDATVNTKPQLEIFANDVRCSHGTSTGKVDEDAMFYLKSRGIGEEKAKKLLLHAFAAEVISKVKNDGLRSEIEAKLDSLLSI